MNKCYCLDTNVLIQPWNTYYAHDICPSYWVILKQLAAKGIIICPDEVRHELERKDDNLIKWAKDTPKLFEPLSEAVQQRAKEILAKFPRLIDTRKGRSMADPWVIALAYEHQATVVTREMIRNRGPDRYGIPEVCKELNVACINDHQFVRDVGIKLSAHLDPPINERAGMGFHLA